MDNNNGLAQPVQPQMPINFENFQLDANGNFVDVNALQGTGNPAATTDAFGNSLATPGSSAPAMNNFTKFGLVANGLTGLAGAYNAFNQTRLMEDQLKFQKNITNRNVANSATTTNTQLGNQADLSAQLTTGAEFGSNEFNTERAARFNPVDGSPVG